MAQASRLWRANGRAAEAVDFLARARRAYGWAEANPLPAKDRKQYGYHFLGPRVYAAAQMLAATGERKFDEDFSKDCAWSKDPEADIESYEHYDMSDAAWAYASCPPGFATPALQEKVRRAIIRRADLCIRHSSTMAYGFIRHPWAPINWGTGAYENWLLPVVQAHELTGEPKYLSWIIRTCDNTLGANPLNRSYVVGAGERTVRAPLHNSRYGISGEVVDGQQVEGPVQSGDGYAVRETAYPRIREDFACLHTFVDVHFAIVMDEGVVSSQAKSMAVFGLLLPIAGVRAPRETGSAEGPRDRGGDLRIGGAGLALRLAAAGGGISLEGLRDRATGFDWAFAGAAAGPRLELEGLSLAGFASGDGRLRSSEDLRPGKGGSEEIAIRRAYPGGLALDWTLTALPDVPVMECRAVLTNEGPAAARHLRGFGPLHLALRGDIGPLKLHWFDRARYRKQEAELGDRFSLSGKLERPRGRRLARHREPPGPGSALPRHPLGELLAPRPGTGWPPDRRDLRPREVRSRPVPEVGARFPDGVRRDLPRRRG